MPKLYSNPIFLPERCILLKLLEYDIISEQPLIQENCQQYFLIFNNVASNIADTISSNIDESVIVLKFLLIRKNAGNITGKIFRNNAFICNISENMASNVASNIETDPTSK